MSVTLSAAEATSLVKARERFGVRLDLGRMHQLLAELGHPERGYRAIHVVGTNGKSSAARAIESLLLAERHSVGTYLSPHVISFAERFRLDGAELDVGAVIGAVIDSVESVERAMGEPVTQFELLTAAALNAFAVSGVDVAVVEAGLGGRYDATNVLDASVVVLTNIGLDHQEQLGQTRELIAEEKLAVLRPGATLVLGEPEWADRAVELGAARVVSRFRHRGGGPLGGRKRISATRRSRVRCRMFPFLGDSSTLTTTPLRSGTALTTPTRSRGSRASSARASAFSSSRFSPTRTSTASFARSPSSVAT